MSVQPTSMIWGPRFGATHSDSYTSDLQHTLGKVMAIASHRRWLLVIPLLTGMIAYLAYGLTLPRRYVLSTTFERRDDVVLTRLISNSSPYTFDTLRRSLRFQLTGTQVVGQAIDDLGLTRSMPRDAQGALTAEGSARRQALIVEISASLNMRLVESSTFLDLIELSYSGSNPDVGMQVVNRLRDNYVASTRSWITDILQKSKAFFAEEAEKRQVQANKIDLELQDLSAAYPGINPNDTSPLNQHLASLKLAIDDLVLRREEYQAKLGALQKYARDLEQQRATGKTPSSRPALTDSEAGQAWLPNPTRERLSQHIDTTKAQIAEAKSVRNMTDMHPEVQGLRRKLEQLRIEFENQPERIAAPPSGNANGQAEPLVDPLAAEQKRTAAEIQSVTDVIARMDRDLARRQAEKTTLEDGKTKMLDKREFYLSRQQEAQAIRNDMRVWQNNVDTLGRVLTAEENERGIKFATVESPHRPRVPTSPTFAGLVLTGLGVGLGLGVAVVFLRELFDRSFRDPARVRQSLGIPVLETIAEIRSEIRRQWLGWRTVAPAFAAVEAVLAVALGTLTYLSLQYPDLYQRIVNRAVVAGYWSGATGLGA
ncbi:MAG TPA: hypothetical protein PKY77_06115 [Phycisphaerae bacterium]|nr:hypothetical protein [Phycisphaerae bacterium]HRY68979.1 hypothetical protein [Phycisphaerae bacterium]HSA26047.1 hypothetical protein [Phycisphaerae bacterium]